MPGRTLRLVLRMGQITMRRADGWKTPGQAPVEQPIDLAARLSDHRDRELRRNPIPTNYRTRPPVRWCRLKRLAYAE